MTDWLEAARTGIYHLEARRIGRDSDGNCYRIKYGSGAAESAARAAERQLSHEASVLALVNELEKFETRVFEGDLKTS